MHTSHTHTHTHTQSLGDVRFSKSLLDNENTALDGNDDDVYWVHE